MAEETERSVEDRIGDMIFGNPEEEAPEEAPEEPVEEEVEEVEEAEEETEEEEKETEEEYAEIEIDGEVLQVPKKYEEYFLRQQDYTQKTQDLARQRQEVEVVRQQAEAATKEKEFLNSVWNEMLEANQYETLVKQYKEYLTQNIDNLSATDVQKIQLQIEQARDQYNELTQAIQGKYQEFQQAQQQSKQELLKKGTEILKQKIPGWNDEAQKQVREYALSNGFTEAEVSSVVDPRQVEVLWKAKQYDQLKKGAKPAVQKVSKAPQIKPKSRNPMPKETQDKLNLRKKIKNPNKSAKDKAVDIGQYVGSRFGI